MSSYTLDYMDESEKLLEELRKAVDQVMLNVDEIQAALTELNSHNGDAKAHPDIRKAISNLSDANTDLINTKVSQHNESTTAHPELRTLIEKAAADSSKIVEVVSEYIDNHNNDANAHSDIREILTSLQLKISEVDIDQLEADVAELLTKVNMDIASDIVALQTVDAHHDNLIATNASNISLLSSRVTNVNTRISLLASTDTNLLTRIDQNTLRIHEKHVEDLAGYITTKDNGPQLRYITTSLPTYVKSENSYTFYVGNITPAEGSSGVTIAYSVLEGDFVVNEPTSVANGDNTSITIGTGVTAGEILSLLATITDDTTGVVVQKVLSFMVARPIDNSLLNLDDMPTRVEPGALYQFKIVNLADDGTDRYTYEFDPEESGIEFNINGMGPILNPNATDEDEEEEEASGGSGSSPSSSSSDSSSGSSGSGTSSNVNALTGIPATMQIPDNAERNTTLGFSFIVHDSLADDTTIAMSVGVNQLPVSDNFWHNIPSKVVPGQTYTIKFSGISSIDGVNATYSVSEASGNITFSKTSDILTNENITMTVSENATRGGKYTVNVVSTDKNNINLYMTVDTSINVRPTATGITTTLPSLLDGGTITYFRISGGVDEDSTDASPIASYSIDAGNTGWKFSKTVGISPNEVVSIITAKPTSSTTGTFYISCTDKTGETSLDSKPVSVTVEPVYVALAPTITSPENGDEVDDSKGFTMAWTGFRFQVDTTATGATTLYAAVQPTITSPEYDDVVDEEFTLTWTEFDYVSAS